MLGGRTKSQTQRSWNRPAFPASTASSRKLKPDGQAILLECLTADCNNSGRMANCVRASAHSRGAEEAIERLKGSLKDLDINPSKWESFARDRPTWRRKVSTGAPAAENRRAAEANRKRAKLKARAASTSPAPPTHACPIGGRALWARISLSNHLRTHMQ